MRAVQERQGLHGLDAAEHLVYVHAAEQAKTNARLNEVQLIERRELERMLGDSAVTMLEVEKLLCPEWGRAWRG